VFSELSRRLFYYLILVFNDVFSEEVLQYFSLPPPQATIVSRREKELKMQENKLFVGNLAYSVTSDALEQLFAGHGSVVEAKVIEGKGFGFVEMSSKEEADVAKEALNGTEYSGRSLNVDTAKPPKSRDDRSDGGGYRRY
jgi:RNA recognition motif-containing protein